MRTYTFDPYGHGVRAVLEINTTRSTSGGGAGVKIFDPAPWFAQGEIARRQLGDTQSTDLGVLDHYTIRTRVTRFAVG